MQAYGIGVVTPSSLRRSDGGQALPEQLSEPYVAVVVGSPGDDRNRFCGMLGRDKRPIAGLAESESLQNG